MRLKMQGRSLINVLLIMRKRLITYAIHDSATVQDVEHCELLVKDIKQRWDSPDGFAACLVPVDAQMQHVCIKLFQECNGNDRDGNVFSTPHLGSSSQACWKNSRRHRSTWPPTSRRCTTPCSCSSENAAPLSTEQMSASSMSLDSTTESTRRSVPWLLRLAT